MPPVRETVDATLKINQQIELVIKTGVGAGTYYSRVEELTRDSIHVATPLYKGYPINYRPGEVIEVNYIFNNAAVYSFVTQVLEAVTEPIPLLVIKKPKTLERIQRRSFVRLDAHLPVTISKLTHGVEVIVKEGPFKGTYETHLEGMEQGFLSFYLPLKKERFIPLTAGLEVDLVFTLQDGSKYTFTDQIKKVTYAPLAVFKVNQPIILRLIEKNQSISLPLEFKRFRSYLEEGIIKGETLDIGGGGLMFNSSVPFEAGDSIDLKIELPGQGIIRTFGDILRSTPIGSNRFKNSLKFTRIYENDRDRVIQFIFQRQMELRRKGLM